MTDHGYTTHGHSLPGKTQQPEHRPQVANCGGPIICKQCRQEVATAMKEMFQQHQSEDPTSAPGRDQKDRLSQTFGKYVADSRRRNFLSQQALADRMNEQFGHNWHQTVVGKIENGTRELKAEELFHLAVIFKHYELADPIVDIIGKYGR